MYLAAPEKSEDDPRNIFPKVVTRLEQLGFSVIPVNKTSPIAGAQGSGFVVGGNGHILTCAHLFEKEKAATLWITGTRYDATVVKADKDKDIALLKITDPKGPGLRPLPIEPSPNYKMGQEVYTIGFPLSDILGNAPRLNKGLISSTVGLKDSPDHLQVSVETQSGNSGSPLLDGNGRVIGMLQSTLSPLSVLARTGGTLPQNVNFALKATVMNDFLAASGEELLPAADAPAAIDFESASKSLAQVRAGKVTEEFLKQPKLIALVRYSSFWDIWYRFRFFYIEFYDFESRELLLRAGQYRDNMLSTEGTVLDQTFAQIREKFIAAAKEK